MIRTRIFIIIILLFALSGCSLCRPCGGGWYKEYWSSYKLSNAMSNELNEHNDHIIKLNKINDLDECRRVWEEVFQSEKLVNDKYNEICTKAPTERYHKKCLKDNCCQLINEEGYSTIFALFMEKMTACNGLVLDQNTHKLKAKSREQ